MLLIPFNVNELHRFSFILSHGSWRGHSRMGHGFRFRICDVITRNNSVNSLTPFHDKRRTADSTDVCRLRCSGLYRGLPIAMYRDATIMDTRQLLLRGDCLLCLYWWNC
jgi:hypothetical protein